MAENPELRRLVYWTDSGALALGAGNPVAGEALPTTHAAALAVLGNPFGKREDESTLQALAEFSDRVGQAVSPRLVSMLDAPATRYGKGAVAGSQGSLEQLAALLHPRLGKPMREAIGGGKALIPSTQKIGGRGTLLDVPIAHKDDPWAFAAISTLTLGLADAPAEDEFLLIVVLATDAR